MGRPQKARYSASVGSTHQGSDSSADLVVVAVDLDQEELGVVADLDQVMEVVVTGLG